MKYRKKPVVIEAITFDELVEFGRDYMGGIKDIPWSFRIKGTPISHENNDRYLIHTLEGVMDMTREDMLIIGIEDEIYPCKINIFNKTYEVVE